MKNYLRCDALEQLDQAWREAALGTPDKAKRHIGELLERLDDAGGEKAREYIETATHQPDSLSMVLALVAAMQELEHESANGGAR